MATTSREMAARLGASKFNSFLQHQRYQRIPYMDSVTRVWHVARLDRMYYQGPHERKLDSSKSQTNVQIQNDGAGSKSQTSDSSIPVEHDAPSLSEAGEAAEEPPKMASTSLPSSNHVTIHPAEATAKSRPDAMCLSALISNDSTTSSVNNLTPDHAIKRSLRSKGTTSPTASAASTNSDFLVNDTLDSSPSSSSSTAKGSTSMVPLPQMPMVSKRKYIKKTKAVVEPVKPSSDRPTRTSKRFKPEPDSQSGKLSPLNSPPAAHSLPHSANPSLVCFSCGLPALNEFKMQLMLIKCSTCSNKWHPSCLHWSPAMCDRVDLNTWQCSECKACDVCKAKVEEDKMLFCDVCDLGFHMYCLNPPLPAIPKDDWMCPLCSRMKLNQVAMSNTFSALKAEPNFFMAL